MADSPCFELVYPSGEVVHYTPNEALYVGDGIPHFATETLALRRAHKYVSGALGIPSPRQLPQPCVYLSCSGCEWTWDEEEGHFCCFTDRAEALKFAKELGWQVDGDEALCNDCKAQTAVPRG